MVLIVDSTTSPHYWKRVIGNRIVADAVSDCILRSTILDTQLVSTCFKRYSSGTDLDGTHEERSALADGSFSLTNAVEIPALEVVTSRRGSRSAEGEQRVGEQLRQLETSGWMVFNDVHWPSRPKANLDQILIGPGDVLGDRGEELVGHCLTTRRRAPPKRVFATAGDGQGARSGLR
jgi:hypothetical protein